MGPFPSHVTSVVRTDAEAMNPGFLSQQCSQLILLFINATSLIALHLPAALPALLGREQRL